MKHLLLLSTFVFTVALANAQANTSYQFNGEQAVFTENQGQVVDMNGKTVPDVLAKASVPGLDMYLTKTGVTYVLLQYAEDLKAKPHPVFINDKKLTVTCSRVDVALTGASLDKTQMQLTNEADWQTNYYKSADAKGQIGVSHFKNLTIQNVYPGIDWVWKFNNKGNLEYEFVVHPGADPAVIKMQYSYANLKAAKNSLVISTRKASLTEGPLLAKAGAGKVAISYNLTSNNQISFTTADYDKTNDLVIDPPLALNWSADFGGSFTNGLRGVTVDSSSYVYLCGYTTSNDFPTLNPHGGAYIDSIYNGGGDAILLKLDTNQHLKWATYLGGPGDDFANSVVYSHYEDAIYVTGGAQHGFPIYQGDTSVTGQNIFVASFNKNLALTWSTFYGGNGTDEGLKAAVGQYNELYIVGYTNSTPATFSTFNYNGGYNQSSVVGIEAFIMELLINTNSNNNLVPVFLTKYGGSGDDYATCVAIDSLNNIVAGGYTTSTNLPLVSHDSAYYQATNGGGTDGFIVRFDGVYHNLINATYYGGSGDDYITDVATGINGNFGFTGRTNSANFPLHNIGGYGYYQAHLADATDDAFIFKTANNLTLKWATYYGGNAADAGTGIATDNQGRFYLSGFTFSTNFPVDSFPGAYNQEHNGGNSDGFIARFSDLGIRDWSTYKGDSCYQYPYEIAFDKRYSKFYIAGQGLLACVGDTAGQSIPDTGQVIGGVSSVGFCWSFNGPSNPVCQGFGVSPSYIYQPCPGQCNGMVQAFVSDGQGPITYVWSNGSSTQIDSSACPQEGWVEVSDTLGCKAEANLVFFPLSINMNSAGVVCLQGPGGMAIALAAGGNRFSGYLYDWSEGSGYSDSSEINVSDTGVYAVTVSDGRGCTIADSIDVPFNNLEPDGQLEAISYPSCGNNRDGTITLDQFGTDSIYPAENVMWTDVNGNVLATGDTFYNASANTSYYAVDSGWCYNGVTNPAYYFFTLNGAPSLAQIGNNFNPSTCVSNNGIADVVFDQQSYSIYSYNPYIPWGGGLCIVDTYPSVSYLWSDGETTQNVTDLSIGTYTVTLTDYVCETVLSVTLTLPTPQVTPQIDSIYCNSGAIDLTGTYGGLGGPYTYNWSTGLYGAQPILNSLLPGNYSATITDEGGCADTVYAYLPLGTPLQANIAVTNAPCYGQNGVVYVTGEYGVPPYQYTGYYYNYTAGTYNYTIIDAEDCEATANFTINQPPPLIISLDTVSLPICTGSDATFNVTATGGTPGYTGTGTITEPADTDVITVSDANACTASETVVVSPSSSSNPIIISSTFTPILCYGGNSTITITATGGHGTLTGTGTFIQTAGTYYFTVTDSVGCSATATVVVTQPGQLQVNVLDGGITCNPDAVNTTVSGGVTPYQYQWNTSPGFGDSAAIYVSIAATYYVTVQDANGCTATASDAVNYLNAPPPYYDFVIQQYPSCGQSNGLVYFTDPDQANVTWIWPVDYSFVTHGDTLYNAGTDGAYYNVIDSSYCVNGVKNAVLYYVYLPPAFPDDNSVSVIQPIGNSSFAPTGCNTQDGYLNTTVTNVPAAWTYIDNNSVLLDLNISVNGYSPITYQWSNGVTYQLYNNFGYYNATGITNLDPGTYYLTVTDGTCQTVDSITLTATDPPLIANYQVTNPGCSVGLGSIQFIRFTNSIGTNTYAWSNGATTQSLSGLTAGTYMVTITGPNACPVIDTFNLTFSLSGSISINVSDSGITCHPDAVNASVLSGTGPYQYQWSTSPGFGDSSTVYVSVPALYSVTVQDANGCSGTGFDNVNYNNTLQTYNFIILQYPQCGLNNGVVVYNCPNPSAVTWQTDTTGLITYGDTITNVSDTSAYIVNDYSNCVNGAPYLVQYSFQIWAPFNATGFLSSNPNGCNTQDGSIGLAGLYSFVMASSPDINDGYSLPVQIDNYPHYQYHWSNGITYHIDSFIYSNYNYINVYEFDTLPNLYNLNAGTYTVTVTDGACQQVYSYNLVNPPQLVATYQITEPGCGTANGGSLQLSNLEHDTTNSEYGPPYYYVDSNTFAWSNNATTQSISNLTSGTYTVTITGPNACPVIDTFNLTGTTSTINIKDSIIPIACFNGTNATVIVTATGGTSPYTGTGAFIKPPGNYILTVTDASGCSANDSIVVHPSLATSALVPNETTTPVLCHGNDATVTISATGGIAPYTGIGTYQKPAGNYVITVTDSTGCSVNDTFNITQPGILYTTNLVSPILCYGGTATINLSCAGGTAPYTGTGTFTRPVGNYVFDITDANGCIATDSVKLTQPTLLSLTDSVTPVLCYGSNATVHITATGGTPPYYGAGAVATPAGNQILVVSDANGCADSVNVSITQPSEVLIGVQITDEGHCVDSAKAIVTASGGTGPYTGLGTFVYTHNGPYTIAISDANGCGADTVLNIRLDTCTGVATVDDNFGVMVYPNPASDKFYVKFLTALTEATDVRLYAVDGKLVMVKNLGTGTDLCEMDCNMLASGVYVLRTVVQGREYNFKVVVTR